MTPMDSVTAAPRPVSGFPKPEEAAAYYSRYISRIAGDDIVQILDDQRHEAAAFLNAISEEQSLHRYAPEKWSIRGVLSHVNDTERVFVYRAFWFARGLPGPLPSFDQELSAPKAGADRVSWACHVEDFRAVRLATVSLLHNLAPEAWNRSGVASDNPCSVRALAYITAGHLVHHLAIIRERYLKA